MPCAGHFRDDDEPEETRRYFERRREGLSMVHILTSITPLSDKEHEALESLDSLILELQRSSFNRALCERLERLSLETEAAMRNCAVKDLKR